MVRAAPAVLAGGLTVPVGMARAEVRAGEGMGRAEVGMGRAGVQAGEGMGRAEVGMGRAEVGMGRAEVLARDTTATAPVVPAARAGPTAAVRVQAFFRTTTPLQASPRTPQEQMIPTCR